MTTFTLPGFDLAKFIRETLAEDLGEGLPGGGRDVTSESVIPADARFSGVMDSRDAIVVAGLPLAGAFFRHLDPDCTIETLVHDGDMVPAGTDLMRIEGRARALLTAERSALNIVQHLSGIATKTQDYVTAMRGPGGNPFLSLQAISQARQPMQSTLLWMKPHCTSGTTGA